MEIDAPTYNKDDLTIFASYRTEVLAALFAESLAQERGWNAERIVRTINLYYLSGGRSGELRNPKNLWLEGGVARNYYSNKIPMPDQLQSFTWTPIQKKILEHQ